MSRRDDCACRRASAPTARGSVGALMHGQSLPERGHARMPGSLATAVGSSSISHPSITEPPSHQIERNRWSVARGVVRSGPRVSTADLPHLADDVLSYVHFYTRATTAGSLECRGRPWSRIPPRPTQGQPPAVGEVEGTTTRQHCSSAAIWRSSPRADTHERPPAKRHHACLPASL